MLETVGFSPERETLRMVKDPVKHGGGKNWVSHHLSPLGDFLVGCKDDGGSLISIAYECKEPVGLGTRYWGISDLILWEVKCYGK